ncbi:MAG: hypothetical protein MPW14_08200 [Candidatus Manganitrophus sp.]|nr:MAG: hypothetical protein MPW14_08200 [Candidatus Manganitrophus sp.]
MGFPTHRPRRLRESEALRRMVRETELSAGHLIYPLFVTQEKKGKSEIASMPGQYRLSIPELLKETTEAARLGIPAVILFGIPKTKDDYGSAACDPRGVVPQAIRAIKEKTPDLLVITDVCIDEYTSHGHCGVVKEGKILNDETVEILSKMALAHAEAGADMIAPSDMMDGRVRILRKTLDENGQTRDPDPLLRRQICLLLLRPFSGCRPIGPPVRKIDKAIRWMRPIGARRSGRWRSISKKEPIS